MYKYTLTIQDGFSRWVQAIPLRSMEAVKVVDSLYQGFVCLFGAPMHMHTDNRWEFQDNIWSSLLKRMHMLETKTLDPTMENHPLSKKGRCLTLNGKTMAQGRGRR